MPLNFYREGATAKPDADLDTGTNKTDSVKHIENSDPVEETFLQRSPENLRFRSEDVRTKFDDLELVQRSDRGLVVMSDPDAKIRLQDKGTNEFIFALNDTGSADSWNRDLVIGPLVSAAEITGTQDVLAKYYYDDAANGEFSIVTNKRVYEGASNIYFRMFKGIQSLGNTPICTVDANSYPADPLEGPVVITIELSADNDTLISGIVTAIDGNTDINGFVDAEYEGSSDKAVTADLAPVRLYGGDDGSVGGVDGEIHIITSGVLENFFEVSPDLERRLLEGDSLVINYDNAKTRQSKSAGAPVTVGDLSIISSTERIGVDTRNTADAQGIIPICKILGGKLYFLNGKVFEEDVPDFLVSSSNSSVSSDILADLAAQTGDPDTGDHMVGAEVKTNDKLTVAVGTVNSQLHAIAEIGDSTNAAKGSALIGEDGIGAIDGSTTISTILAANTLRSHVSSINSRYQSTTGAGEVGASGKTGAAPASTKTLVVGNVNYQLQGLLDYYDNHVYNANASDKHTYPNIDGRPVITVGATNSDYATFEDAMTTGQYGETSGAIIIIAEGSYSESLAMGAVTLDYDVDVIGSGNVKWTGSAATLMNFSSSTVNSRIHFHNIHFECTGAANITFYHNGTHSATGQFIFTECTFERTVTATAHLVVAHSSEFIFENCSFVSSDNAVVDLAAIYYEGNLNGKCRIAGCKFKSFGTVLMATAATPVEKLVFDNNTMVACGYAQASSVLTTLIRTGDADNRVWITNNHVLPVITASNSSLFCDVHAEYALIAGNLIEDGIGLSTQTAVRYMISAEGRSLDQPIIIRDNTITCDYASGIYAKDGVRVLDNSIVNVNSDHSAVYGIYLDGTECYASGNYIQGTNASEVILINSAGSQVINNKIYASKASSYAIKSTGISDISIVGNHIHAGTTTTIGIYTNATSDIYDVIISNNVLEGSSGSTVTGIKIFAAPDFSAHGLVVSNNQISAFLESISVFDGGGSPTTKGSTAITGNVIRMRSDSSAIGIKAGSQNICVSGNNILGGNQGTPNGKGILVVNSYVMVSGNIVSYCATGIDGGTSITSLGIAGNMFGTNTAAYTTVNDSAGAGALNAGAARTTDYDWSAQS